MSSLEDRVGHVEGDIQAHREDDTGNFGALRNDIAKLGTDLGKRIDEMGKNLQGQITDLTLDKAKAEGRAEGIASIAANKPPLTWSQWLVRIVAGALAAALLSGTVGLVGWMGSTIWSLEQEKISQLQRLPTATVTVNPAQAVQPIAQPTAPAPGTPPSALSDDPPAQ